MFYSMNIKVVGIKARSLNEFSKGGLSKTLNINGNEIPLYFGNSSLPNILSKADFAVGPLSTAMVETVLLGKDYYIFQSSDHSPYSMSHSKGLYQYVNISTKVDQLKNNIEKRSYFKNGCTIEDFVNNKENYFLQ